GNGRSKDGVASLFAVFILFFGKLLICPDDFFCAYCLSFGMLVSLNVGQLAYVFAISCTAFGAYFVYKVGLTSRDVAQRNAQFRTLQIHFLLPYLLVLLAESIQAPYLYVLYHVYGFLPSQISVLYVVGLTMNVIGTVLTVHLLSKFDRRMLCLCCVASSSLACLLKFSDNYLVLLIGRLLDGLSAALITAPFQQWYGHEHVMSFDFPKEWLASTFALLSLIAGFLSVLAGFIAEFAESISSITAFPFFFAILFQLAGGCYIMCVWPANRIEPEHRIPIREQFISAVTIFKKKPVILVLCAVHTLFESTLLIFIFVWTPLFLHSKAILHQRISYGVIYAAFMSCALLGGIFSRHYHKRLQPTQILFASSSVCLITLVLSVCIIPSTPTEWTKSLFNALLLLFCLFEFAVGSYVPAMNKLQIDLLPAEHRQSLLALLRIPLTVISSCGMLFLHSGNTDWQIVSMGCVLLSLTTLCALLLHMIISQNNPQQINDHFVLTLNTNVYDDSQEDEDNLPQGLTIS
ncbi:unnamed protein product, partial [Anisakis simplex]|uniref:Molybdate-anion transporter n=1 Tax=Anisakis simplex TaxID=6269 RepID=A0A0M3JXD6_ANISI